MISVKINRIVIDEEMNKYRYELTNDIIDTGIEENQICHSEMVSTDNDLGLTVYYSEDYNYFYAFVEDDMKIK